MLDLAHLFFQTMNSSDIRYCHWKSNGHLDQALNGNTDLDLLIHQNDEAMFRRCLGQFPFIIMQSPPAKTFPFIEDYLGFDEQSGKLLHLHVHYRLILGQRFIKNHHLPIESLFWSNLAQDQGVAIPAPELELLVLVIRAAMKLSALDILKHGVRCLLGRQSSPFPQGIEQEFHSLLLVADIERLKELLTESKLPLAPERIVGFLDTVKGNAGSVFDFILINRYVLRQLQPYRRRPFLEMLPRSILSNLREWPLWRRLFPSQRKIIPQRGYAVAVLGADGSGKSTITADLRRWLSWKLTVRGHYYGIPKTGAVKSINFLVRMANLLPIGWLKEVPTTLLWVFIARRRAVISEEIEQDCVMGRVAIIDRFPHPAFVTMAQPMDGPRLTGETKWLGCFFASREAAWYRCIRRPDLMLALKAPVEVLRSRKTDLGYDTHVAKAEAVNALQEDETTVSIDAALPYPEVLLQAKKIIWGHLMRR